MRTLVTERLLLREWQPADAAPMAAINRDPEVGRYLNRPVDEASIEAFYDLVVQHWDTHGYGPWVVESREPHQAGEFLGFAGLAHVPPMLAAAGPDPELGWRLTRSSWGRGLATEAALAARDDAFGRLGLPALISIIHPENVRSQRVAAKLGLSVQRQIENPVLGRLVDVWGQSAPTTGARTEVVRHLAAARPRVYRALTTAEEVAQWRFPAGMTCQVHTFEAVEGGRVRVSLTYATTEGVGKSGDRTDTYNGRFERLVPDELVVEVDEFETADPAMRGEMTMTLRLADADGGTLLTATHEGIPDGVTAADNETGWREAFDRLARLVGSDNASTA